MTNLTQPAKTPPAPAPGITNLLAEPAGRHQRVYSTTEKIAFATSLALLVLGAVLLVAWWRRRGVRRNVAPPPPPPLPPHVRARLRLEAAFQLLADPNAFCTEVSAILRTYLEERFGWNAPDRTTEEFLAELRRQPRMDAGHQATLESFLTRCDVVKFARYDPTETELRELHRAAALLVEETTPVTPVGGESPAPPGGGSNAA